MKSRPYTLLVSLFFSLIFFACESEDSIDLADILKGQNWTQKIDSGSNSGFGNNRLFHLLSFQDNGYCNVIYNLDLGVFNSIDTLILDTVEVKYFIENNKIIFPKSFREINFVIPGADTTRVSVYISDYEKKSIVGNIVELERISSSNKDGFVIGSQDLFIEPI